MQEWESAATIVDTLAHAFVPPHGSAEADYVVILLQSLESLPIRNPRQVETLFLCWFETPQQSTCCS